MARCSITAPCTLLSVSPLKSHTKLILFSWQNPSKPHFNHYLFEALCLSIKITCRASPEAAATFEAGLFPPFEQILQQDVQGKDWFILNARVEGGGFGEERRGMGVVPPLKRLPLLRQDYFRLQQDVLGK